MSAVLFVGAPERKRLDALREQRRRIEDEIDAVRASAWSHEEGAAVVLAALKRRRDELRHEMSGHVRGPQAGALPADVVLWLMTDDELDERVRARVAADNAEPGLPRAEREKRRAALADKLEQLLVDEEHELDRLERAGLFVEVRAPESAADVDRILAVWNDAPAAET